MKPHYKLVTCKNLWSKYDRFNLLNLKIWQLWEFYPKTSFFQITYFFPLTKW